MVEVNDDGIGIHPAKLCKIFDAMESDQKKDN